jgi:hypothetical protein
VGLVILADIAVASDKAVSSPRIPASDSRQIVA